MFDLIRESDVDTKFMNANWVEIQLLIFLPSPGLKPAGLGKNIQENDYQFFPL